MSKANKLELIHNRRRLEIYLKLKFTKMGKTHTDHNWVRKTECHQRAASTVISKSSDSFHSQISHC